MLRRRKKASKGDEVVESGEVVEETTESPAAEESDEVEVDRTDGPFDITEVEQPDADVGERLDLGAVQLPLLDGLEVRVEMDSETNSPAAITVIRGEGAVQIRAFSAPKSGGGWDEARGQIRSSITSDGGTVDDLDGPFGREIVTTGYAQDEQGNAVAQRLRFAGVDGPRWMLQGLFFGAGAVPEAAELLDEVFRSIVVVRGDSPMPPGVPLELTLPKDVPGDMEEVGGEDDEFEDVEED